MTLTCWQVWHRFDPKLQQGEHPARPISNAAVAGQVTQALQMPGLCYSNRRHRPAGSETEKG